MHITNLSLNNFRSYEEQTLSFGSRLTILQGACSTGKSSLLYALSWCLTGACRITHRDGKLWEHLVHDGAKVATVEAKIDGLGYVRRRRGGRKHTLEVEGIDSDNAKSNQALLYDRLKTNHETLSALLDPQPFTLRPVDEQRSILLRVLRPPEIPVTDLMKRYRITKIEGVEHLDRIIRALKEENLRDLRRQDRELERSKPPIPQWPWAEDMTEDKLRKARKVVLERLAEEQKRMGGLEEALRAAQEEPTEQPLSDKERSAKDQALKKHAKALSKLEEDRNATFEKYEANTKQQERHGAKLQEIMGAIRRAKGDIEELPEQIDCPADACPIREQYSKEHGKRLDTLQKRLKAEEKRYTEASAEKAPLIEAGKQLSEELKSLPTQIQAEQESQQALREELIRDDQIRKTLASKRDPKDIDHLRSQLAEAQEQVQILHGKAERSEEAMKKIDEYRRTKQVATEWTQKVTRNLEQQREVKELIKQLEGQRANIIGDKIDDFLAHMNTFLEPFERGLVSYDWDEGFTIEGRPIHWFSHSESAQFFEAALRVAIAKTTGLHLVVIDHEAPTDKAHQEILNKMLIRSECQVIQAITSIENLKPTPLGHAIAPYFLNRNHDKTVAVRAVA